VATSCLHENSHVAGHVVLGAAIGIAAGRVTLRRARSLRRRGSPPESNSRRSEHRAGVLHARRDRVKQHGATMIWIFVGALIVAGVFTLWRGRIMHDVLFGRG